MGTADIVKMASAQDWERKCDRWAQGPAQTEQEKCENAERMVRAAISAWPAFKGRDIKVFVQGSYRNRTNVRAESDVDVCVLCKDTFFPDYSHVDGISNNTLGFPDASYGFTELKRDVEAALVAKFGRRGVTPGDKAFDIKENTYRVSADVVPTFEGRLYYRDSRGVLMYHSGTVLKCTSDGRIIKNWPEQHYANGVRKREQTDKQFKKKVRCLKNLCNEMASSGIASAEEMASFLLESLVYNCPNHIFTKSTHHADVKAVIAHLWHATKTDETAKEMLEVNERKYLFHSSQPWRRSAVHTFLHDAWNYKGFST